MNDATETPMVSDASHMFYFLSIIGPSNLAIETPSQQPIQFPTMSPSRSEADAFPTSKPTRRSASVKRGVNIWKLSPTHASLFVGAVMHFYLD